MTLKNYINGVFVPARNRAVRTFYNPADNTALGEVAESAVEDIEAAIKAARKAFDEGPWSRTPAVERAAKLFKLANLIDSRAEELALMESRNNGKPLREARFDVADAAACFRYYAGLATQPSGQSIEVGDPNIVCQTVREPIGVCGQIIPWNYPLLMAAWKLAPGLAAGNCCILKPSELTPLSVSLLFEMIDDVGFPPGCVQLVYGPGDPVGSQLAASPLVDKIAFTGGGVTGRKIQIAASSNFKKSHSSWEERVQISFSPMPIRMWRWSMLFSASLRVKGRFAVPDPGCSSTGAWAEISSIVWFPPAKRSSSAPGSMKTPRWVRSYLAHIRKSPRLHPSRLLRRR